MIVQSGNMFFSVAKTGLCETKVFLRIIKVRCKFLRKTLSIMQRFNFLGDKSRFLNTNVLLFVKFQVFQLVVKKYLINLSKT